MSYFKTVALGLDDFGAAVLLNRNDLCISAACGLVLRGQSTGLNIRAWQVTLLTCIGHTLDFFWPGHCAGAIQGDIARANSSLSLLRWPDTAVKLIR